jgi:RNA polymerase sigma-70 factor (ECF subfamily)
MTGQDLAFSRALEAARAGDTDAFGELWTICGPRLDRYLEVVAGDDAPDVAAATWAVAAAGLRSFAGDDRAFRGVLARVARAEALSRRRLDPPPAALPPSAGPLAALAPDVAEMVALRVVIGMSRLETAGLLGIRPGFVTVAVHGGLRRATAAAYPGSAAFALPNPWQLDGLLDRLAEADRHDRSGSSVLSAFQPPVRRLLVRLTAPGPAPDPAQLAAARPIFEQAGRRTFGRPSAALTPESPAATLTRLTVAGGPYVHPRPMR